MMELERDGFIVCEFRDLAHKKSKDGGKKSKKKEVSDTVLEERA